MAPATTLIFLHIPKTGGTTFSKILERNFARKETLTLDGADHRAEIRQFIGAKQTERARYRLIQGHLHFGLHESIPGSSTYVTYLRDPIARALSFYSYARAHSSHYLYRRLLEERLDLKTLLKRNGTPELFNHQTRMIAGGLGDPNAVVDRRALEQAKENLHSKFSFVGLTEEFDASLLLMSRTFGWPLPLYERRNVTNQRLDSNGTDPETLTLLGEANLLDLELHEFARKLLEEKRRHAGSDFERELVRFDRLNSKPSRVGKNSRDLKSAFTKLFRRRDKSEAEAALKESPIRPSI